MCYGEIDSISVCDRDMFFECKNIITNIVNMYGNDCWKNKNYVKYLKQNKQE